MTNNNKNNKNYNNNHNNNKNKYNKKSLTDKIKIKYCDLVLSVGFFFNKSNLKLNKNKLTQHYMAKVIFIIE